MCMCLCLMLREYFGNFAFTEPFSNESGRFKFSRVLQVTTGFVFQTPFELLMFFHIIKKKRSKV